MSERFDQLSARHRELRVRSDLQRQELASIASELEERLSGVDRSLNAVRRFVRHPGVIAGGLAVLSFLGPRRLRNVASRSAMWLSVARSLVQAAKAGRDAQAQKSRRVAT